MDNGVVSGSRTLSTGLERSSVDALQRSGKVWEFKVPQTTFNEWINNGSANMLRDLDAITGIINQEVRLSPRVAPKLNEFIVK